MSTPAGLVEVNHAHEPASASLPEYIRQLDGLTSAYLDSHPKLIHIAREKDDALKNKTLAEARAELQWYPGIRALAVHEKAHAIYEEARRSGISDGGVARAWSEAAHAATGIDIHPGVQIGEKCFIDHGTGVVIGETARLGNGVRILQGVTIGAYGTAENLAERHPILGDDCFLSADVQVLGRVHIGKGVTFGPGARVFGNHVVVEDGVTIGTGAEIGDGNTIAAGVNVHPGAIIPKGIGRIESDVPAYCQAGRDTLTHEVKFYSVVPSTAVTHAVYACDPRMEMAM